MTSTTAASTVSPRATMPAFRLLEWQRPAELVETAIPSPGPGEVLIQVAGCGLCHSDLTISRIPGEIGEALGWRVPFTLGHETAGWVAALGRDVKGMSEGDAVALVSPSSCGTCRYCRVGQESTCLHGDSGRGFGRDGGLATHVVVEADRGVIALGDLDPRHAGPLTDAGATSHHAVTRVLSVLEDGGTAVVIGAGGLGSFAVQILRTTTGARVVAVDTDAGRRDLAVELGAHDAVDGAVEDLGANLRSFATEGVDGVDAVLDLVGSDSTIASGVGALRRGGAFVLVGADGGGFGGPWFGRLPREATITTVQGSSIGDLRAVVALARDGRVHAQVEEFRLARVEEAYAALEGNTVRGRAVVIP